MESHIRRAALLVCLGLIVAFVSLLIGHPLAFIMFLAVGAVLVGIGVVYYLLALVRVAPGEENAVEVPTEVRRESMTA